jgi:hypothetical protein
MGQGTTGKGNPLRARPWPSRRPPGSGIGCRPASGVRPTVAPPSAAAAARRRRWRQKKSWFFSRCGLFSHFGLALSPRLGDVGEGIECQ